MQHERWLSVDEIAAHLGANLCTYLRWCLPLGDPVACVRGAIDLTSLGNIRAQDAQLSAATARGSAPLISTRTRARPRQARNTCASIYDRWQKPVKA